MIKRVLGWRFLPFSIDAASSRSSIRALGACPDEYLLDFGALQLFGGGGVINGVPALETVGSNLFKSIVINPLIFASASAEMG